MDILLRRLPGPERSSRAILMALSLGGGSSPATAPEDLAGDKVHRQGIVTLIILACVILWVCVYVCVCLSL